MFVGRQSGDKYNTSIFVLSNIFNIQNIIYPIFSILTKGGVYVISYEPFWKTLAQSPENWYTLTTKHHLSFSTLSRLKNGQDISLKTINDLCRILNCQIQDIAQYIPSENDQKL